MTVMKEIAPVLFDMWGQWIIFIAILVAAIIISVSIVVKVKKVDAEWALAIAILCFITSPLIYIISSSLTKDIDQAQDNLMRELITSVYGSENEFKNSVKKELNISIERFNKTKKLYLNIPPELYMSILNDEVAIDLNANFFYLSTLLKFVTNFVTPLIAIIGATLFSNYLNNKITIK